MDWALALVGLSGAGAVGSAVSGGAAVGNAATSASARTGSTIGAAAGLTGGALTGGLAATNVAAAYDAAQAATAATTAAQAAATATSTAALAAENSFTAAQTAANAAQTAANAQIGANYLDGVITGLELAGQDVPAEMAAAATTFTDNAQTAQNAADAAAQAADNAQVAADNAQALADAAAADAATAQADANAAAAKAKNSKWVTPILDICNVMHMSLNLLNGFNAPNKGDSLGGAADKLALAAKDLELAANTSGWAGDDGEPTYTDANKAQLARVKSMAEIDTAFKKVLTTQADDVLDLREVFGYVTGSFAIFKIAYGALTAAGQEKASLAAQGVTGAALLATDTSHQGIHHQKAVANSAAILGYAADYRNL